MKTFAFFSLLTFACLLNPALLKGQAPANPSSGGNDFKQQVTETSPLRKPPIDCKKTCRFRDNPKYSGHFLSIYDARPGFSPNVIPFDSQTPIGREEGLGKAKKKPGANYARTEFLHYLVINLNPFLHDYKVTITENEVDESAVILAFLGKFSPLFDGLTGGAADGGGGGQAGVPAQANTQADNKANVAGARSQLASLRQPRASFFFSHTLLESAESRLESISRTVDEVPQNCGNDIYRKIAEWYNRLRKLRLASADPAAEYESRRDLYSNLKAQFLESQITMLDPMAECEDICGEAVKLFNTMETIPLPRETDLDDLKYKVQLNAKEATEIKAEIDSFTTNHCDCTIPKLAIASPSALPLAIVNLTYKDAVLNAVGPLKPLTWTVSKGTLPPGLTLDTDGRITGTPTRLGPFPFTVTVTDPLDFSDTKEMTIEVVADAVPSSPPPPRSPRQRTRISPSVSSVQNNFSSAIAPPAEPAGQDDAPQRDCDDKDLTLTTLSRRAATTAESAKRLGSQIEQFAKVLCKNKVVFAKTKTDLGRVLRHEESFIREFEVGNYPRATNVEFKVEVLGKENTPEILTDKCDDQEDPPAETEEPQAEQPPKKNEKKPVKPPPVSSSNSPSNMSSALLNSEAFIRPVAYYQPFRSSSEVGVPVAHPGLSSVRKATAPVDGANEESALAPRDMQQPAKSSFGVPRFALSGGVVSSPLAKQEFQVGLGIEKDRQGNPVNGDTITEVIVKKEDSNFRIGPILLLNFRPFENLARFHLSVGITGTHDDKGTSIEYLFGPSLSFLDRLVFLTGGVYIGRQLELAGDAYPNLKVDPMKVMTVPVRGETNIHFGISISFKIK